MMSDLPQSNYYLSEAGIEIRFETVDVGDPHPNTYRLRLKNEEEEHSIIAISTGGGMIEVIEIDGFKLSMLGDYRETLTVIRPLPIIRFESLMDWIDTNLTAMKSARPPLR
jgi:iron-sulfur-dependent L-serine dehydratase beta subunit